MDENFRELLEALDREGAKYLIIGGYAVGAHGHMRATKDLDILIATSAENAEAVFRGLAHFGAPLAGMTAADFNDEKRSIFMFGTPPFRMTSCSKLMAWTSTVPGIEELWSIWMDTPPRCCRRTT